MGALGSRQETAADVVRVQHAGGRIDEPALLVIGEALLLTLEGIREEEHAVEADPDGGRQIAILPVLAATRGQRLADSLRIAVLGAEEALPPLCGATFAWSP